MRLFSQVHSGGRRSLIVLHGLFGMSENWSTFGKEFSQEFEVHLVDLRNHGRSPHAEDFDYEVMCEDLLKYIQENNLDNTIILGHSQGGKVAMKFAFTYPEKIEKLLVADISPRRYNTDFVQNLLQTLYKLPLQNFKKREEIDRELSSIYEDRGMRLFLLKNLYRNENKEFAWRFNIEVLLKKVSNIQEAGFIKGVCTVPTNFIRGGNSNYITSKDELIINKHFSDFSITTIDGTGHWLHVESPQEFHKQVRDFIREK